MVAPSSIADLEVVAHAHRQFADHRRVDSRRRAAADARRGEPGSRAGRRPDRRPPAAAASARRPEPRAAAGGFEDRREFTFARAVLGRLARQVHLHEQIDAAARRGCRGVHGLQQRRAVDGMNHRRSGRPSSPCSTADDRPGASESRGPLPRPSCGARPARGFRRSRSDPASAAARTYSVGKVFETATSWMDAGSRRARSAAAAILSRTAANRALSAEVSTTIS